MFGNSLPKVLERSIQKKLLAEYVKTGDLQIRETLILHNLRLVKYISLKYKGGDECLKSEEDLFNEGILGLIKALESYNPHKGEFSVYAAFYIKAGIRAYIRDKAQPLRVPGGVYETLYRIESFKRKYIKEYFKEPSIREISIALEIPKKRLKSILDIDRNVMSLDSYISDNKDLTLGDTIQDPESDFTESIFSSIFVDESIKQFANYLNDKELKIIVLNLGLNCKIHTIKEVSIMLNMPYEKVADAKTQALRKLRRSGYMARIKKELDDETIWYSSPSYEGIFSKNSYAQSQVEKIVIDRERRSESLLIKEIRENI